jgi:alkyldihydroxyacetonephosphate synthase
VGAVLDWAGAAQCAVTPFGGGSTVVGGVEAKVDGTRHKGAVTIDLRELGRVLEVDKTSRAARIEGGAFGPALEAQLKPHGLTLRHFPQSFEFSTLGGWIATRSGGHFATLYTHIDDLVESLRVVTPAGMFESRRLPGSGAGPSPDRLMIGSEGILGIITQAWMRLQDRPTFRAGGAVRFADFFTAARALRVVAQSGLYPANCRILDPAEAYNTGAGDGSSAIMVLAFESGDHPVEPWMARALECCADFGGAPEGAGREDAHREGAAGRWRNAFIRMPYARERLIERAVINDTFETAITWERFEAFHDAIKAATEAAIVQATGRSGQVTCRCTHVYPDGPAPYFTFHALGRHGALIEQWSIIKSAALDAVIAHGGTVTHHHAVGRDHRPWYDRQRPPLFAAALKAAKQAIDPQGLLNPGVLID